MTFGSLFAGIGGLDLGLERAGMTCKWQVEIDPYCHAVLRRYWPTAMTFTDITNFAIADFLVPLLDVDVIVGGFPCQDISWSNPNGQGIDGPKSGLWSEYKRVLGVLRPRYAIIENVPALLFRGLHRVLWDLAEIGFDAEWESLPASAFGAPHKRDRIFIVAYPAGQRRQTDEVFAGAAFEASCEKYQGRLRWWRGRAQPSGAYPDRVRWIPDGELCRVANGVPDQLERYRGLGNAVVPQVAEWIGRRILEADGR